MNNLLAAIIVALASSSASANIIYSVDRTIGAGSVVGTIETDGTSALHDPNIVAWTFTLTSASLTFGSPQVISSSTGGYISELSDAGQMSATATDISWDFASADAGYWFFYDPTNTYWYCLESGANGFCAGGSSGESIGFGPGLSAAAETASYSTAQVIATTNQVPEPAGLALVALGLMGVGLSRRKQR